MSNVANITIDHTKVDADLTDFPIFIDLSDLPDSFWDVVANGGGDIRIFKEDGETELSREIVACNTTAKTGEIHVKYTGTLSSSSDTTIQIHADGSSSEPASDSTYGSENVWGSSYQAVYHMNESSGSIIDSTSNDRDASAVGSLTYGQTGEIGKAIEFGGDDDYFDTNANFLGNYIYASCWVNFDSFSNYNMLLGNDFYDSGYYGFRFAMYDNNSIGIIAGDGNTSFSERITVSTLNTGIWYKISTFTDAVNGTVKIWIDGGVSQENTGLNTLTINHIYNVLIGQIPNYAERNPERAMDGKMDNVIIRNIAPSDDWESTEYNNQSSPSTFYTASEPVTENTTNFFNFF